MISVVRHEDRPLLWWYANRSSIDMQPSYQRSSGIWRTAQKKRLIDSILNGYDIPKIYLADFSYGDSRLNSRELRYAVIDGKQRFECIFDFFEDAFPLENSFIYLPDPRLELGGAKYASIRRSYPEVAKRLENFALTVMSVFAEEEGRINELFIRLNQGKPLTGAEIRNAMGGAAADAIRSVAGSEFLRSYVSFDKRRGQDRNLAAKLLLIEYQGRLVDVKKTHLDRFVEQALYAEAPDESYSAARRRVEEELDHMEHAFMNRDPLLRSAGPIVIYYWLIRSVDLQLRGYVRDFLVDFEARRKGGLMKQRVPSNLPSLDQDVQRYETLNRSTNDAKSLQGRFEILFRHFINYVDARP
jgi:Protein of unknown function DUF262